MKEKTDLEASHDPGLEQEINWEKQHVPPDVFALHFREAVDAIEAAGIHYAIIGGIASSLMGRPRHTQDADFFVKPADAEATLVALETAGFLTQKTNPHWIYKGHKNGLVVDVIFRVLGDIYVDDEMVARAKRIDYEGRPVWVVCPEDLVVIKAAVASEEVPHHWFDALGVLASCELDWEYLLRRARSSARRVLSLLVYAESNDLIVSGEALRSLFDTLYSAR